MLWQSVKLIYKNPKVPLTLADRLSKGYSNPALIERKRVGLFTLGVFIMSMVIGTNVASITAQRHLSSSRNDLENSMERLSSGNRINSAMDDAAGLSITSRMDSQINGLTQAVRNASDAISLSQTAEGALEESTAILQRMRDLAVQSVSDTNTATDRTAINTEVTELKTELTRIGNSATFNDQNLLDSSFSAMKFQIGHKNGETVSLTIGDMRSTALGIATAVTAVAASDGSDAVTAGTVVATMASTTDGATSGSVAAVATMTFTAGASIGDSVDVGIGASAEVSGDFTFTTTTTTAADAAAAYVAGASVTGYTLAVSGDTVTFTGATDAGDLTMAATVTAAQVAASDAVGRTLAVAAADAVTALSTADVSTQLGAATAILQIDSSIKMVDAERAKLGAFSNRLEHTVSNLSSMVENTSAARSRIADADFAVESANLAKNQVLQQAGTAMLSQANASTQNVLSLLK